MKYNIYSIQDTMIGFQAPFIMQHDEVAKREYANFLAKNPNAEYMRLYKLGVFVEETGEVIPQTPECIDGGKKVEI